MIQQNLVDAITRPPRNHYLESELQNTFNLANGDKIQRQPIEIFNKRHEKLIGSFYEAPSRAPGNPCVIYLHGNSSNQSEGIHLLGYLSELGISLCCFDTSGSGNSDGNIISLGYTERDDVEAVINYLRENKEVQNIVLWGRSMGAATAAWYAGEHYDISGIISDSPYKSVMDIAYDFSYDSWFMRLLLKIASPFVSSSLKRNFGFSLGDINVSPSIKNARCPALFVHAYTDTFINVREARELFTEYGGQEKYLLTVKGNHNSARSRRTLATQLRFLLNCFDLEIDDDFEQISSSPYDDHSSQHFENVKDLISKM